MQKIVQCGILATIHELVDSNSYIVSRHTGMKYAKSIEEYFSNNSSRKEELTKLREILNRTELEETLKWGMPTYVISKRNIIGIGAFKNWSVLWFHDGALLKDQSKVLVNAQEGKTKGMRQWRFNDLSEINESLILEYVNEAITNCKNGRKVIKNKKKSVDSINYTVPGILQDKLDEDAALSNNWANYTERQRRDLSDYVSEPKREATKLTRLEKVIPLIKGGKPLAALWSKS